MQQPALCLKYGSYADLHTVAGLQALDRHFIDYVSEQAADAAIFIQAYRKNSIDDRSLLSDGLIRCAELLDQFLIELFSITEPARTLKQLTLRDDPIFWFKQNIVLKSAKRRLRQGANASFKDLCQPIQDLLSADDAELSLALAAQSSDSDKLSEAIVQWCVSAMLSSDGQAYVKDWVSFQLPKKLDFDHLFQTEIVEHNDITCLQSVPEQQRNRQGFDLTDSRQTRREVMNEIHYCVYCHKNDGDFCSTGFPLKKKQPELGYKVNPLGEVLAGCPLDEKISEMNALKRDAYGLGALAMVMLDNPMCPATGHRICNDCMKACIYQRQTPVNIPEIETRVLTDVLSLPWGVEIYDLLTRWNPLRQFDYLPKPYNGKHVMVMGMGPAGFTLAHYLTQAGYAAVGMDGLKIEKLDSQWLNQPIYDYQNLEQPLSTRPVQGFGGVAEYGITVRWDKNFLKLIYLSLMRRQLFQLQDGVRFGGSITVEKAWQLGFDHLAVAVGAGLPKELPIASSLAPGMRQANDFLMALQLTGAARENSLANLQIRLPAVVIGSGLTGVDTATEVQAYYLEQVKKIQKRYAQLCKSLGDTKVRLCFNAHDLAILDEYLDHANQYNAACNQARINRTDVDTSALIRRFGGVTIVYRKAMQQSPAYRNNPEELAKAMEEGLFYAEHLSPYKVLLDDNGDCSALVCHDRHGKDIALSARCLLVATGAKPNVAYAFEHKDTFERDGYEYQAYKNIENSLVAVEHSAHSKNPDIGLFTSYDQNDLRVTFLGDANPSFHGSVVKAIASGKQCFDAIDGLFAGSLDDSAETDELDQFMLSISDKFSVTVITSKPLSNRLHELIVRAPLAKEQGEPGQFYRLQRYDEDLTMEGVACLAMPADKGGAMRFVVETTGASSRWLSYLQAGESFCLMGPTGVYTKLPEQPQDLLVVGQWLAIPYILSLKPLIETSGHRVHFVATIDDPSLYIYQKELADLCTTVTVISGDSQSMHDAILVTPNLASIDQVHVIGGRSLLCQMQSLRNNELADRLASTAQWIGSVYGPMQCMLKGVCAQCLQWQVDKNGKRTKAVYACSWQHQPFDKIDINNIADRLSQNSMQEQLTNLWLKHYAVDNKTRLTI